MSKVVSKVVDVFSGGSAKKAEEARRQAEEAQNRANASAEAARRQAENLRVNTAQDLSLNNVGEVVAGGTAADVAGGSDLIKKKKGGTASLSSTLGLM